MWLYSFNLGYFASSKKTNTKRFKSWQLNLQRCCEKCFFEQRTWGFLYLLRLKLIKFQIALSKSKKSNKNLRILTWCKVVYYISHQADFTGPAYFSDGSSVELIHESPFIITILALHVQNLNQRIVANQLSLGVGGIVADCCASIL